MKSARYLFIFTNVICALSLLSQAHSAEPGESPGRTLTSIERLQPEHLAAAHRDVTRYQEQRREIPPLPGLTDYQAILHAHAGDSSHTGGTLEEIHADAIQEGVDVIMLSDHFRPPRDFMDGWRGLKDGVLFIPGSEAQGFLLYPEDSIVEHMDGLKDELIEATIAGSGLIFLSHVEERMQHPMDKLTGMEVYNRHADALDDNAVLLALMQWVTDPAQAEVLADSLAKFPDEVLAAQLDYPVDYFAKWDAESQQQRVVGIAANDCHHNQVFIVKMLDEETVLLGTVVDDDDEMRNVTASMRPGVRQMTEGREPGDILGRYDFDPYHRSFRNVSTHVLAPELSEAAIRQALAQGRAYISHDWMCDPIGTRYYATGAEEETGPLMGGDAAYGEGQALVFEVPVDATLRLIRNGEEVLKREGVEFRYEPDGPGVYRAEAWLTVDGEQRPWIYTNPIYLR